VPGTLIQTTDWSPAPILDAVEQYRGTIIDLDSQQVFSPDDFARARQRLVRALRRAGLAAGDRVLVALPNGPLFMAALTAILACDASPLLLHFQTPAAELLRYARRFGARFLAAAMPLDGERPELVQTCTSIAFASTIDLAWCRLNVPDEAPPGPVLKAIPLHPTSGSTGLPKIALRPGFAAMEEARHYAATMAIDQDDCLLTIPPMSHAYAYGTCVMLSLLTGARLVTTAKFSVKLLMQVMEQYPITVLPNVPAAIDMMLFGSTGNFNRLRWMLAAGSMLPRRSAERFRKKTGITVCPLYGTTETGGISVATTADGMDVDGRVGPPMEGVEVRIQPRETEDGIDQQIGNVCVRSSSMMAGYLDEEGHISSPLVDGWFETGDLARLTERGVLHLRGRTGEMINVQGLKVVPAEVEETIARLPGVREVKVYASLLKGRSEIVKAAVAVEPYLSEREIRSHCEQHLVYYKRPQSIVLLEALPRSPAGKILRDQLP
jgi:acyl-CoA synthetase (AMP-forming)/AMP-acid ligase II